MIVPATVVLTVELDVTQHPIAGCVIDRDGHERPFTGWVALTQILTAALADGRARQTPPHFRRST